MIDEKSFESLYTTNLITETKLCRHQTNSVKQHILMLKPQAEAINPKGTTISNTKTMTKTINHKNHH